jgi:hypothetical protein
MAWDVFVCRFAQVYENIERIPWDEEGLSLGSRAFVKRQISKHFPETDWVDVNWGQCNATFGSIEFSIGTEENVDHIMLHVRASDEVVSQIIALCAENQWQALDTSTGRCLVKCAHPLEGLQQWHAFRDSVVPRSGEKQGGKPN